MIPNTVLIEPPVEGRLWRTYTEGSDPGSLASVVAMWDNATMSDPSSFEEYELHPEGDVWLAENRRGFGYGRAYSIDVSDDGEDCPLPGRYRKRRVFGTGHPPVNRR